MVNKALRKEWEDATARLPWGIHTVFNEALQLVADEKIKMVYGTDDYHGSPCLVNSIHAMFSESTVSPSSAFPEVVGTFDRINSDLGKEGINDNRPYLSPMAAEILLRWMAPAPPKPVEQAVNEATQDTAFELGAYREPTDADVARDWLNMLKVEAAQEDFRPCGDKAEAEAFLNEQHAE
jgi:hypothetical protein